MFSVCPTRLRVRVDEVERVPVQVVVVHVGDVVHRLGDEVDRDDVQVRALGAGEREPLGQRVAQLLDQLEEVVGPVDLVHRAGLGVADDDARAVDAQRRGDVVARELLGLELRAVVGVRELLALVEHVLAEQALVAAGDGDRGRVVEAADVDRVRELDDVARALDVRAHHRVLVGGHVVHRGEVEEVVDLLVEGVDAELLLRQVARHGDEAVARAERLAQVVEPAARSLAYQREHLRVVALEQLLDEVTADEAGGAGDEVVQRNPLPRKRDSSKAA